MTVPVDPKLATAASAQHELTQRKLEMDALRKRLRTDPSKEQKLREACEGFESIFVQKMWEQMRATLPKEGYLHSKEEEFWQSMFDQELAKKMTSAGGIGLADMIYEQLSTKLTDASRTTAPSSVREPVPVKPVSLVPRMITPASEAAGGGKAGTASSMYEPASPEAPVAGDAQAPGATSGTGEAGAMAGVESQAEHASQAGHTSQAGHAVVQQHLAELERQVAAAPPAGAATPTISGVAGGDVAAAAAGAAVAGTAGAVAATGAPGVSGVAVAPVPAATAEAGQAGEASSKAQRRTARGLPAASVAGENTRKVRSPMRDAQLGPPIVHRTGAMKRVASPAATRTLSVPTGAPTAAELQAAQGEQAAVSGDAVVGAASPMSGATPSATGQISSAAGTTPSASGMVSPAAGVASPAATSASPASPGTSATPAAPISKVSPTGGPAVALGTPGTMTWPHEGRIASGFGWRNDPITGERAWHPGVDIAVADGDPVRAAWDGKVVFAGERADYGRLVVLEHPGGWRSFYGHNGSLDVREGDVVRAGTEIAKAGGTGRVAGPHLHFEVRQGELAVNPEYAARSLASGGVVAQRTRTGG